MLCFLVDYLAFTYNVDLNALRVTLSTTPLASTHAAEKGVSSILSQDERSNVTQLATIVDRVCRKVQRQQFSSIPDSDFRHIYNNVHRIATEINVKRCSILLILNTYLDHCNNPVKWARAALQSTERSWRSPFAWSIFLNGLKVAKQLVSDDVLNELVAPNEETRILIGSAIAHTSNQYRWFISDWTTCGTMRGYYTYPPQVEQLAREADRVGRAHREGRRH